MRPCTDPAFQWVFSEGRVRCGRPPQQPAGESLASASVHARSLVGQPDNNSKIPAQFRQECQQWRRFRSHWSLGKTATLRGREYVPHHRRYPRARTLCTARESCHPRAECSHSETYIYPVRPPERILHVPGRTTEDLCPRRQESIETEFSSESSFLPRSYLLRGDDPV